MNISIYQIDAFADECFKGNPAAVCPLNEWISDDLMLKIAAENNLSETAFFVKKDNYYEIKWFTPVLEVDLCGHATLASAHVLFNHLNYDKDIIEFSSKSGLLKVFKKDGLMYLDFPARAGEKVDCPKAVKDALGIEPLEVYKSRDYMAVLSSEDIINNLSPDINKLKDLDSFGLIITAKGCNVDFVSRFFAPNEGIFEDPVTGSAHCTLIPYWAEKLGKVQMDAVQVSKRTGKLSCVMNGDRVLIGGEAKTYMSGTVHI